LGVFTGVDLLRTSHRLLGSDHFITEQQATMHPQQSNMLIQWA
jgi:hypothetical protein